MIFSQFCSVFSGMSRIARLEAVARDEQNFYANVNTDHLLISRQQCWLELAKTGDKIASSPIFANSNSGWIGREFSTPFDRKRFSTFGKGQLTVFPRKSTVSKFSGLLMFLGFKSGVLSTSFKKVFKSRLLMPQALLKWNTRYLIQPSQLRLLFDFRELGICSYVTNPFLRLIVRIGSISKDSVIDKTNTSKRFSKQLSVFLVWIKSEFVSSFSHVSYYMLYNVKHLYQLLNRRKRFLPVLNDGVSALNI